MFSIFNYTEQNPSTISSSTKHVEWLRGSKHSWSHFTICGIWNHKCQFCCNFFITNTCAGTRRRRKRERQKLRKRKRTFQSAWLRINPNHSSRAKLPNVRVVYLTLPTLSSHHLHVDNYTSKMLLVLNTKLNIILFHSLCIPLSAHENKWYIFYSASST